MHRTINTDIKTPPRISFNWIWGEALEYSAQSGVSSTQIKEFVQYLEQKHRSRTKSAKLNL